MEKECPILINHSKGPLVYHMHKIKGKKAPGSLAQLAAESLQRSLVHGNKGKTSPDFKV